MMDAVASTTHGRVRGTVEGGVAVFRGVPYAQAPVGPLRFAAPVAPVPWDGERAATAYGPAAPQIGLDGVAAEIFAPAFSSGEDCLTLNVWTPDPAATGTAGHGVDPRWRVLTAAAAPQPGSTRRVRPDGVVS